MCDIAMILIAAVPLVAMLGLVGMGIGYVLLLREGAKALPDDSVHGGGRE